jgi:CheY-like chemotaxis protein
MKSVKLDPQKRGRGRTVLVVDDNPAIRKIVARTFLSDGFGVCGEASNGRDAIELAKKLLPDLIILDLDMPVMNGLQAAPELRKIVPQTPIILFTMYGNGFLQSQTLPLGIDFVLSKTENLDTVLKKAHQLIGD